MSRATRSLEFADCNGAWTGTTNVYTSVMTVEISWESLVSTFAPRGRVLCEPKQRRTANIRTSLFTGQFGVGTALWGC